MPATTPKLSALLERFEAERQVLDGKIEEVEAKIKKRTKKHRKAQAQKPENKEKRRKRKEQKREEKRAALQELVESAERQEKSQPDNRAVTEAWTEANEAKALAEKTVEELRSLRAKGKAGPEKIIAARQDVRSCKLRAAELAIAAILAEDDFEETVQREGMTGDTAMVGEAHGSVEESLVENPWIL